MYKLAGQEMNVKKLCRKENITNYGETTVAFILVASCIYPVFFFLDLPLVLSDVDQFDLRQPVGYFQWSTVPGCLLQLFIR